MVVPPREPDGVRNDQPDEADHAAGRNRRGHHQRRGQIGGELHPLHGGAQVERNLLSARQKVEGPGKRQDGQRAGHEQQGQQTGRRPVGAGEVPHHPEDRRAERLHVGEREQKQDCRVEEGTDDHARKDQDTRVHPTGRGPPRNRQHQRHRGQRTGERAQGEHPGKAQPNARHHDRHRADGGSARYAQHVGLGERVAQERLKGAAAEAERSSDERGQCRARQPQLEQDGTGGGVGLSRKKTPQVRGTQAGGAERDAERDRGHYDQREECEPAGGVRQRGPCRKSAMRRAASATRGPGRLKRSPSTTR